MLARLAWVLLAGGGGDDGGGRVAAPVSPIAPITPAEFEKWMKELVPKGAEPWQTIGWRVDLLAARDEAIEKGRPLFLWAMNGHPLGCV